MADNKKHSIRERVKTGPLNSNWFTNVAKSMGFLTVDMAKVLMPNTADFMEQNATDTMKMVQDMRKNISSRAMIGRQLKQIPQIEMGKNMLRNTLEDVKSGKIYNNDRKFSEDKFDNFDDFLGDDDGGIEFLNDDDDDLFVDEADSSDITINKNNTVKNVIDMMPLANVVSSGTQATVQALDAVNTQNRAFATEKMMVDNRILNTVAGGLESINENMSTLVQFHSDSTTKYYATSIKFYEDFLKSFEERVGGKKTDNEADNSYVESLYSYTGNTKLKKYMERIKANMKEMEEDSLVVGQLSMMLKDTTVLNQFVKNPLGTLMGEGLKKILKPAVGEITKGLDEAFSSLIPAVMARINTFEKSDSKILEFIYKAFGSKVKYDQKVDLGTFHQGEMPWNGLANKTLTEVIPTYLRRIESAITGAPERIFDANTGKFSSVDQISKNFDKKLAEQETSGYTAFTNNFNAIMRNMNISSELTEQMQKQLNEYYRAMTKKGSVINPFVFEDMNGLDVDELSNNFTWDADMTQLFRTIMGQMSKKDLSTMASKMIFDSRVNANQFMDEIRKDPNKHMYSTLKNESTYDENGKLKYDYKVNPLIKGNNGETEGILSNIMLMLARGIVVYPKYGVGNPNTDMFERHNNIEANRNRFMTDYNNQIQRLQGKQEEQKAYNTDLDEELFNLDEDELKERVKKAAEDARKSKNNEEFKPNRFSRRISERLGRFGDIVNRTTDTVDDAVYQILFGGPISAETTDEELMDYVRGKLDEAKNGDMFSGIIGSIQDTYRGVLSYFTGKSYRGSDGQVIKTEGGLVDKIKSGFNKLFDIGKNGNNQDGDKPSLIQTVSDNFMDGFKQFKVMIFGEKDVSESDMKETIGDIGNKIKQRMPKAIGKGALITTVKTAVAAKAGLLGSLLLPGGPIAGMLTATTFSFLRQSETFNKWLFGDKDQEGNRMGGFIPKSIQDMVNQHSKGIKIGGAVGAGVGMLPFFFLPGGPITGSLLGAGMGIVSKTDKFQEWLFGDNFNDKDNRSITNGKFVKFFKDKLPSTGSKVDKRLATFLGGTGIIAGIGQGVGLLPSFLLPGGPIVGAMFGLAGGILASTDKFQQWLFGDKEADGRRYGGILTQFTNWFQTTVMTPFKIQAGEIKDRMLYFVEDKVVEPFRKMFAPLTQAFKFVIDDAKSKMQEVWGNLTEGVIGAFNDNIIKPFGEKLEKYVVNPLKKLFSTALSMVGKVLGTMVSLPIKLTTGLVGGLANKFNKRHVRKSKMKENREQYGFIRGTLKSWKDRRKDYKENIFYMSDEYKEKEKERKRKKQEEREARKQERDEMWKQYEEDREFGKKSNWKWASKKQKAKHEQEVKERQEWMAEQNALKTKQLAEDARETKTSINNIDGVIQQLPDFETKKKEQLENLRKSLVEKLDELIRQGAVVDDQNKKRRSAIKPDSDVITGHEWKNSENGNIQQPTIDIGRRSIPKLTFSNINLPELGFDPTKLADVTSNIQEQTDMQVRQILNGEEPASNPNGKVRRTFSDIKNSLFNNIPDSIKNALTQQGNELPDITKLSDKERNQLLLQTLKNKDKEGEKWLRESYKKQLQERARKQGNSHADGLDEVPEDGYAAELHKGEMVVPEEGADDLRELSDDIGDEKEDKKDAKGDDSKKGNKKHSIVDKLFGSKDGKKQGFFGRMMSKFRKDDQRDRADNKYGMTELEEQQAQAQLNDERKEYVSRKNVDWLQEKWENEKKQEEEVKYKAQILQALQNMGNRDKKKQSWLEKLFSGKGLLGSFFGGGLFSGILKILGILGIGALIAKLLGFLGDGSSFKDSVKEAVAEGVDTANGYGNEQRLNKDNQYVTSGTTTKAMQIGVNKIGKNMIKHGENVGKVAIKSTNAVKKGVKKVAGTKVGKTVISATKGAGKDVAKKVTGAASWVKNGGVKRAAGKVANSRLGKAVAEHTPEVVSKSKQLVQKLITKAGGSIKSFAAELGKKFPGVKFALDSGANRIFKLLTEHAPQVVKKFGTKICAEIGEDAAKSIPVAGWIVQGGMTVYDLATGFTADNTANLFQVPETSVDGTMRGISSVIQAVSNFGWFGIIWLVNDISKSFWDISFLGDLAKLAYKQIKGGDTSKFDSKMNAEQQKSKLSYKQAVEAAGGNWEDFKDKDPDKVDMNKLGISATDQQLIKKNYYNEKNGTNLNNAAFADEKNALFGKRMWKKTTDTWKNAKSWWSSSDAKSAYGMHQNAKLSIGDDVNYKVGKYGLWANNFMAKHFGIGEEKTNAQWFRSKDYDDKGNYVGNGKGTKTKAEATQIKSTETVDYSNKKINELMEKNKKGEGIGWINNLKMGWYKGKRQRARDKMGDSSEDGKDNSKVNAIGRFFGLANMGKNIHKDKDKDDKKKTTGAKTTGSDNKSGPKTTGSKQEGAGYGDGPDIELESQVNPDSKVKYEKTSEGSGHSIFNTLKTFISPKQAKYKVQSDVAEKPEMNKEDEKQQDETSKLKFGNVISRLFGKHGVKTTTSSDGNKEKRATDLLNINEKSTETLSDDMTKSQLLISKSFTKQQKTLADTYKASSRKLDKNRKSMTKELDIQLKKFEKSTKKTFTMFNSKMSSMMGIMNNASVNTSSGAVVNNNGGGGIISNIIDKGKELIDKVTGKTDKEAEDAAKDKESGSTVAGNGASDGLGDIRKDNAKKNKDDKEKEKAGTSGITEQDKSFLKKLNYERVTPTKSDYLDVPGTTNNTTNNINKSSTKMVFYSQNDSRWSNKMIGNKTMADAGCGPTSAAMAISQLTGKMVTPEIVAALGRDELPGYSTFSLFPELADKLNMNYSEATSNYSSFIKNNLKQGIPVIVSGKSTTKNSPYTKDGHIIMLSRIDGDKVFVQDPKGKEFSKYYKLQDVLSGISKTMSFGLSNKMQIPNLPSSGDMDIDTSLYKSGLGDDLDAYTVNMFSDENAGLAGTDSKGNSVAWGYFCDPSKGGITALFGQKRSSFGNARGEHGALDYNVHYQPLFAPKSGTVVAENGHWSYGNALVVKTNDGDMYYRLAHMSKKDVKKGDKVKMGQKLGVSGNTGHSTGPHVHFEILKGGTSKGANGVDPLNYYDTYKSGGADRIKIKGGMSYSDYMKNLGNIAEANAAGSDSSTGAEDSTATDSNSGSSESIELMGMFSKLNKIGQNYVASIFNGKEVDLFATTGTPENENAGVTGSGDFPKYNLNEQQIKGLAHIVEGEQPGIEGHYAEASLMANLNDISGNDKATTKNLIHRATSGWFANGAYRYNHPGNPASTAIQAVRDVIVGGKRTLPRYVNEHDCFSDLTSVSNNGKSFSKTNRSEYKQYVTKIKNRYGASGTFYTFPNSKADPFYYTSEEYRKKWGENHYTIGSSDNAGAGFGDGYKFTDASDNLNYYNQYFLNRDEEPTELGESIPSDQLMVDDNKKEKDSEETFPLGGAGGSSTATSSVPSMNGYAYYSQVDKQWNKQRIGGYDVAHYGCGPTSASMMLTTMFGKQITPYTVAKWAYGKKAWGGGGMGWSMPSLIASNFGLNLTKEIQGKSDGAFNSLRSQLNSGHPVMLSGRAPDRSEDTPFTPSGHIVLAVGTKGNDIVINDPRAAKRSKAYTQSGMKRGTGLRYGWAFSKTGSAKIPKGIETGGTFVPGANIATDDGSGTSTEDGATTPTESIELLGMFSKMNKIVQNYVASIFNGKEVDLFGTTSTSTDSSAASSSSGGTGTFSQSDWDKAVFMGDSIMVPMASAGGIPKSRVFATIGDTAQKGLKKVDSVAKLKPPLVIANYGTNDAEYWLDNKKHRNAWYKENYIKLINGVKAKSPNTKFALNQIFEAEKGDYKKGIPSLQPITAEIAQETGSVLVDVRDINKQGKNYHQGDGVHFNSAFYPVWRDALKSKLVSAGSGYGDLSNIPYLTDGQDLGEQLMGDYAGGDGSSVIGGSSPRTMNNFAYFSQQDSSWNKETVDGVTVSKAGCGPTSTSMMLTNMFGKIINPLTMTKWAYANNGWDRDGMKWNLPETVANKFGLNIHYENEGKSDANLERIKKEIKSGYPVIMSGMAPTDNDNEPFTRSGHIVVGVGVDSNGNIIVNDPRGIGYSKAFSDESLKAGVGLRKAWSFGKAGKSIIPDDIQVDGNYNSTGQSDGDGNTYLIKPAGTEKQEYDSDRAGKGGILSSIKSKPSKVSKTNNNLGLGTGLDKLRELSNNSEIKNVNIQQNKIDSSNASKLNNAKVDSLIEILTELKEINKNTAETAQNVSKIKIYSANEPASKYSKGSNGTKKISTSSTQRVGITNDSNYKTARTIAGFTSL